ncbi:hypothetical protein C8R45DRAFT_992692 [Mycena sanguinolenta]|nr:hypothetical protein C8R45DRAFT_992692 [Mycena sanguinolenta]
MILVSQCTHPTCDMSRAAITRFIPITLSALASLRLTFFSQTFVLRYSCTRLPELLSRIQHCSLIACYIVLASRLFVPFTQFGGRPMQ